MICSVLVFMKMIDLLCFTASFRVFCVLFASQSVWTRNKSFSAKKIETKYDLWYIRDIENRSIIMYAHTNMNEFIVVVRRVLCMQHKIQHNYRKWYHLVIYLLDVLKYLNKIDCIENWYLFVLCLTSVSYTTSNICLYDP